jgi:sulfur relay (sulfurtransferase) DsrC/TusE family protein
VRYEPSLQKHVAALTFHILRDKYRKYDISPFTTCVQIIRYIALYEISIENTISRSLRDMYSKYDISPFTRCVQIIRYIALYEIPIEKTISRSLRDMYSKYDISPFTRYG